MSTTPLGPAIERHASPLGAWLLASWAPPALAGVVESMWYFEGRLAHRRERVFPIGRLELIVHLGECYGEVGERDVERYAATCVTGQQLRALVIEAPAAHSAVLGVRFHPAGAYALFGQPVHETMGITVALDDLMGGEAERLRERCAGADSPAARLRAAAAWIGERACMEARAHPGVQWAAAAIERAHGAVRIETLADQSGLSRRAFATRFGEQIGVTPKRLARVARFRRALAMLHTDHAPLARIALGCGYYDQPHFNAEFLAIAGCTPSAYRAALRYPGSASLAEKTG